MLVHVVTSAENQRLTMKRLSTQALNTSGIIKLPWKAVGVQVMGDVSGDYARVVPEAEISAKAIVCKNIISSMYPQWVVT